MNKNGLDRPETFLNHVQELIKGNGKSNKHTGLFTVKTANRWIEESKTTPIPHMLFDEFWFEQELCIFYADTNQGKSILAVQIGNSISKGEGIPGFRLDAKKQSVLYFDFELSAKQFERRYSTTSKENTMYENHYIWDDSFIRIEINPLTDIPTGQSFEQFLDHSIKKAISETGAKVLIIDNLTYLKNDTERSSDAAPLLKGMKAVIDKFHCSILILAHTPKRNLFTPIVRNDLQGSKRLMDFCDSSFAIGESQLDKSIKYLKQIKVRQMEFMYESDNVVVCRLHKPYNFLHFEFLCYATEQEHLKEHTEKDREQRVSEALSLKQQGCSNVDIAQKFGVSEGAVRKWLKKADD